MLKNEYFIAKISVDTAEHEPNVVVCCNAIPEQLIWSLADICGYVLFLKRMSIPLDQRTKEACLYAAIPDGKVLPVTERSSATLWTCQKSETLRPSSFGGKRIPGTDAFELIQNNFEKRQKRSTAVIGENDPVWETDRQRYEEK